MRAVPAFFLLFAALLAVGFIILDQGLSGSSANDPSYVVVFVGVCTGLAFLIFAGRAKGFAAGLNWLIAAAPVLIVIFYLFGDWRWKNRPENAGNRAIAENIRCAAQNAGVFENNQKMLRTWTGIISMEGDPYGSSQKEIESRLRIRILPGCQFERF